MALFELLIHPTAWNKVVKSYSNFPYSKILDVGVYPAQNSVYLEHSIHSINVLFDFI